MPTTDADASKNATLVDAATIEYRDVLRRCTHIRDELAARKLLIHIFSYQKEMCTSVD
jgi:hypothetical protein